MRWLVRQNTPLRQRKPIDTSQFQPESGTCFICEFIQGNPRYEHFEVARTDSAVAFMNKYPTLDGYVLVAPLDHREQVTGDMNVAEYLALQKFVYLVAEAVREVMQPERVYILSLGSQAANAHVHWHIAPLPPGVPLDEQQYHALMHENGALDVEDSALADLAKRIGAIVAPG
jgi:diadenosine tetraphosphate (Ap4A) HIT family hydrolase